MRHLATLLARHGTIAWERAIEPAARVAEQGFVVDTALAARWKTRKRYPEAPDDFFIKPAAIADEIWHVLQQHRSAWSFNVEIRL